MKQQTKTKTKPLAKIQTKHYRDGKKILSSSAKKDGFFDTCATIHDSYMCCNVKVLKAVSNCPYECSYCFLQNYLTNTSTQVVMDHEALMAEVRENCEKEPWRLFRIGTWELGDSLALESHTQQAEKLIDAFREVPNALLELKTKSDNVDSLLELEHQQKTVISWSLNTEYICRTEEHKTAALSQRIAAMEKVAKAGYLVGAHFDPMIWHEGWEDGYASAVKELFEKVPAEQFAWISIGALRFNPEQKKQMETLYPGSPLSSQEMVKGPDNKIRYVKPLRETMFKHLKHCLDTYGGKELFIYLCMERWDMWEKVMGWTPDSIGHVDYLFAESLHQRYPKSVPLQPDRDRYIA